MSFEFRHAVEKDWNHVRCYHLDLKVGDLEWAWRPGGTVEMHLDVDPAYYRQGVGRAMLRELLASAPKDAWGRTPITVFSFSAGDNDKAYGYFTGCGFAAVRLADFYGRGRDAWFYWLVTGEPK